MKSGWLSYWLHWLLLAGGLVLFLGVGRYLPPEWERIDLPTLSPVEDTLPTHTTVVEVRVPPPIHLAERDTGRGGRGDVMVGDSGEASQRILLIGDSMIEWLRLRLASWCREAGYALYVVIWPSSNLIWWGKSDTLRAFIEKYQPTYVLISLGSNELFVPAIEKRKPYVERLLQQVGDLPMVWIGPPAWREDMGIIAFLRRRMGAGRYFSSERIPMERLEDGAHPTPAEAYRWADTLVGYLRDSALYPLYFPVTPPRRRIVQPTVTHLLEPHAP